MGLSLLGGAGCSKRYEKAGVVTVDQTVEAEKREPATPLRVEEEYLLLAASRPIGKDDLQPGLFSYRLHYLYGLVNRAVSKTPVTSEDVEKAGERDFWTALENLSVTNAVAARKAGDAAAILAAYGWTRFEAEGVMTEDHSNFRFTAASSGEPYALSRALAELLGVKLNGEGVLRCRVTGMVSPVNEPYLNADLESELGQVVFAERIEAR